VKGNPNVIPVGKILLVQKVGVAKCEPIATIDTWDIGTNDLLLGGGVL
jgi:hypothetical protein